MHHLSKLTGTIEQRPPIFSAIKKDGQPLYKRARRGETDIEVESRMVTVDGFERTLQVNHLAPFLLTEALLPLLRKGGEGCEGSPKAAGPVPAASKLAHHRREPA